MSCKQIIYSATFLFFALPLQAQVQLGIRMSNYGGINSTLLNPSLHLTSPFSYDINVVEVSQHFNNNYAYLENTSVPELLFNASQLSFLSRASEDGNTPIEQNENELAFDYYDDGKSRYGFELTRILGPSFFVALNENHVVGLVTQFRAIGSGTSIPDNLSFYKWRDRPFDEPFSADPFHSALLSAGEIGLNYMYRQKVPGGWLGLGVTGKYLFGLESYYIDSPDELNLVKPSSEELTSEPFDMYAGFTNSALGRSGYDPSINGGGLGFDFGVTYAIDDIEGESYSWKFGAALLDLGWVSFNKNTVVHEIFTANVQTITSEVYVDLKDPSDLEPAIEKLSTQLYGDPEATFKGDSYTMALPTALSLQVDRKLASKLYVSGTMIQALPLSKTAPRRSSMLAITPRIENSWWGIAMPVIIEQWRDVRLGASFRVGPLFLGTDDLGSFFPNDRFDSADFYAALKINPFGRNQDRINGKRGNQRLRCYDF